MTRGFPAVVWADGPGFKTTQARTSGQDVPWCSKLQIKCLFSHIICVLCFSLWVREWLSEWPSLISTLNPRVWIHMILPLISESVPEDYLMSICAYIENYTSKHFFTIPILLPHFPSLFSSLTLAPSHILSLFALLFCPTLFFSSVSYSFSHWR